MIFITVGAQMAFDRLVGAVDAWAAAQGREDVLAQIGPSEQEPRHIRWIRFMDPPEFRERCAEAELIVAHAGMGSIITALELGKPLLIMPRHGDLLETRNDHQIATARRFAELGQVSVAWDERELLERLDAVLSGAAMVDGGGLPQIGAHASPRLLATLRAFIDGEVGVALQGRGIGAQAGSLDKHRAQAGSLHHNGELQAGSLDKHRAQAGSLHHNGDDKAGSARV